MAERHQPALDAAVSPGGVFGGDADHELADPGGCGRAVRSAGGWCSPTCGRRGAGLVVAQRVSP